MPYRVYSTATNATAYVQYDDKDKNIVPTIKRRVLINGGAGLPQKRTLITRYGTVTEVSDEDMEFLNANEAFKRHKERGFITVSKRLEDVDKVAADMASRDRSAPYLPNDFGDDAPKSGLGSASEVVIKPKPNFGK